MSKYTHEQQLEFQVRCVQAQKNALCATKQAGLTLSCFNVEGVNTFKLAVLTTKQCVDYVNKNLGSLVLYGKKATREQLIRRFCDKYCSNVAVIITYQTETKLYQSWSDYGGPLIDEMFGIESLPVHGCAVNVMDK